MNDPVVLAYFAQSSGSDDENYLKDYLPYLQDEYKGVATLWESSRRIPDTNQYYKVEFPARGNAATDSITKDIIDYKDRIILFHFSGHAGSKKLFFSDGTADVHGLAGLLGQAANLKIVFLNGCATYDQVDFLFNNGIKIVIATRGKISDLKSKVFSETFYRALINTNNTIQTSFDIAIGDLITKGEIPLDSRKEPIIWRSLDTKIQNNEKFWELHVKEEYGSLLNERNWWVIGNLALSDSFGRGEKIKKLFFVYDRTSIENYESFKSDLTTERRKKTVLINGTFDIQDTLNPVAIRKEVSAADVILLLVKNDDFIDFWESTTIQKADLKDKMIIVLKIANATNSIKFLKTDKKIPVSDDLIFPIFLSNKWPDHISNFDEAKKNNIDKAMFKDIVTSKIMNLSEFIDDINFIKPKYEFTEKILDDQTKLIMTCVEGTPNCGQDLLIRKLYEILKKYSDATTQVRKIPLGKYKIYDLESLLYVIAQVLQIDVTKFNNEKPFQSYLFSELFSIAQSSNLILIFDEWHFENTNRDLSENMSAILVEFFAELDKELPNNLPNKICLIVVSRGLDEKPLFLNKTIIDKKSCTAYLNNMQITKVRKTDVKYWKGESKLNPEDSDKLNSDLMEIEWPNYFTPVVMQIGKQLGISRSILTTILSS